MSIGFCFIWILLDYTYEKTFREKLDVVKHDEIVSTIKHPLLFQLSIWDQNNMFSFVCLLLPAWSFARYWVKFNCKFCHNKRVPDFPPQHMIEHNLSYKNLLMYSKLFFVRPSVPQMWLLLLSKWWIHL